MKVDKILRSVCIRFGSAHYTTDYFMPDLVAAIRARYRFFESPSKVEDLKQEGPARFLLGVHQNVIISKLEVYPHGVSIETEGSTEEADLVLDDFFEWASSKFKIDFSETQPVARLYSSAIEFTDVNIAKLSEGMSALAAGLSTYLAEYGVQASYVFHSSGLAADPITAVPIVPNRFTIERRVNMPMSENVFFSEAPLSTDQHVALLERLSSAL